MLSMSDTVSLPFLSRVKRTQQILEVFRVMSEMRVEVSQQAFGSYVISMTHHASHVLEVAWLAKLIGLLGQTKTGNWYCHIRIVPLFETIEDLRSLRVDTEDVIQSWDCIGSYFGVPAIFKKSCWGIRIHAKMAGS